MRQARIKVIGEAACYHIYNRTAGLPSDRPFGPAEKAKFIGLLHKLDEFFLVKVLSYTVMSNHFHLVVHAPGHLPDKHDVCRRYEFYYPDRTLDPADPMVDVYARRMIDISWFMHDLQQQFSSWFNRTRPIRRRGALWAERFKHTLLGDGRAVWECMQYIEMNPVRARIVKHPSEYRYGSFGAWSKTGIHPFAGHVKEHLMPLLKAVYPFKDIGQVYTCMNDIFTEQQPGHHRSGHRPWLVQNVRHWVYGIIIGSEQFIRATASKYNRDRPRQKRRRIAKEWGPDHLCSMRHPRSP